jgi:sugar lactone lactonase YvrE
VAVADAVFSGTSGGAGTVDGTGGAARVSAPTLAFDGSGNLYFTGDDFVVRRMDPAGSVTTVAGQPEVPLVADGAGSGASFLATVGIAFDAGANSLYIGDNGVIRKVNLGTFAVTTIAGMNQMFGSVDGPALQAQFRGPSTLAYDGAGLLYIGDLYASNIRKLDLNAGMVSTFAGVPMPGYMDGPPGTAQFAQPGVLLLVDGKLWVGDGPNHVVRTVDLASRAVATVLGKQNASGLTDGNGSAALFGYPNRMAFDGVQTVWISDGPLRKIDVPTLTAKGPKDASGNWIGWRPTTSLAWGPDQKLYLGNQSNIERFDPATQRITVVAGVSTDTQHQDGNRLSALWQSPVGITTSADGTIWVRDGNSFRKIDAAGNVTSLGGATTPQWYGDFGNLAIGPDGTVYFGDRGPCVIRTVSPAGAVGVFAGAVGACGNTDGTLANARFMYPTDFAFYDNVMYVTDAGNGSIRAIDLAGGNVTTLTLTFPNTGPGFLGGPEGIVSDGNGNLYVADYWSSLVRKIVIATGVVSTIAGVAGQHKLVDGAPGAGSFGTPFRLTLDATKQNLYVADQ